MPKKLAYSYIKRSFALEGWLLLEPNYTGCTQALKCVCPNGHVCEIKWDYWKAGTRCSYCSGYKLNTAYVRESFKSEDYVLLTEIYKNARQKLSYMCPNGHIHRITWGNWALGHRCPYCNGGRRLTIDFVRRSFDREGYELLSNDYLKAHTKLEYKCPKGHVNYITWANWKKGHRCKECFFEERDMFGDKNPAWKGGRTPFYQAVRSFIRSTGWPKRVLEKYLYECQLCNSYGSTLQAHHIVQVHMLLDIHNITTIDQIGKCDLLFDVDNGVALCENCHRWVHSLKNRHELFIEEGE